MKDQNSLISIIVPVFNVESYLLKCIDSIKRQSYTHIEIILVDDGSEDASSIICDEQAEQDSRIRVFHKSNGGLSDARNFGLGKARGDFAVFVDSDDYLGERHIENLFDALMSTKADISVTGCTRVNINENNVDKTKAPTTHILNSKDAILSSIISGGKFESHAWGKLYSRKFFKYLNYPVGKKFEDQYVTYKVFANAKRIAYTNSNDYYYLVNRPGSISNCSAIGLLDHYEAYCQMEAYIRNKLPSVTEQIVAKRYECMAAIYFAFAKERNYKMCSSMQEEMRRERHHAILSKHLNVSFKFFFLLSGTSHSFMFNTAKILSMIRS